MSTYSLVYNTTGVQCPCNDFMNMLQHLISCRIVTIIHYYYTTRDQRRWAYDAKKSLRISSL